LFGLGQTQIVSPIYDGQRQARGRSAAQPSSPNATFPSKVLTALVLEKKRRNPRRQQWEVTMTATENNGGTEQPAAEPEAPAATEPQATLQPAEPVAEQPPAEKAEKAAEPPAEQAAAPTSADAPAS
jgi:hypothetical protein